METSLKCFVDCSSKAPEEEDGWREAVGSSWPGPSPPLEQLCLG